MPEPPPGRDRYLGVRVPRREDGELLTGRARTVADLRPQDLTPAGAPGVPILESAFVRSPLAHALVRRVHTGPARVVPGVAGAWAAEDLPGLPPTTMPPSARGQNDGLDWPALATDRVRYVGQPLAVVLGGDRAHAEDGARAVRLDLEELEPVLEPRTAAGAETPELFEGHPNVVSETDLGGVDERVWTEADAVVECTFREQRLLPTSLEARSILVAPAADGGSSSGRRTRRSTTCGGAWLTASACRRSWYG